MTTEMIQKFVENKSRNEGAVNISMKGRDNITGIFIRMADYEELKAKNFWRVVIGKSVPEWRKTRNASLARIFSGGSFTRLSDGEI